MPLTIIIRRAWWGTVYKRWEMTLAACSAVSAYRITDMVLVSNFNMCKLRKIPLSSRQID